jgi:F1F0 ATPase subunit 2
MDAQAMTSFDLTDYALPMLRDGGWLGGGMLIGAIYFLTLRWNVRMLVLGQTPLRAMTVQLGRFAFAAVVLVVIAGRFGALPLLLTAAGIVAVRPAAKRMEEPA